MNTFRKYPYPLGLAICIAALGLFLILTNPSQVSIGLLVVPVVLVFFISFCIAQILISGLQILRMKPRKRRVVAVVSASLLTIVMILQSTGGISGADLILLALTIMVSAVYIEKF